MRWKNWAVAAKAGGLTKAALTGCVSQSSSDGGGSSSGSDGTKVGYVYVSPVKGSGWTQAWDQARLAADDALGTSSNTVEPIAETADSVGVFQNLIDQGDKIIFATAFGYQPFVAQVAEKNPDVTFVVIGPWAQEQAPPQNVSVVANDSWTVRYALGVLAAKTTKSKTLGFVAANPIPTVIASVNAYELGARSVDPSIQTKVVFTGTWYDPARSTQAAQTLAASGADVIAQYEDSTGTVLGAEKAGVWGIGSEVDSSSVLPDAYLSGSVNDWNDFTQQIIKSVEDGTYKQVIEVGSIESGMAKIGQFASDVPDDVASQVNDTMNGLGDGSIVPFTGPIKDNTGKLVIPDGKAWKTSDDVLANQNFLVEGVVGSIPN